MPTGKTRTLTFRIEPGLKEALRTAAEREHRSIANMVEVMLIRDYCGPVGVTISERGALFDDGGRSKHLETGAARLCASSAKYSAAVMISDPASRKCRGTAVSFSGRSRTAC